MTADRQLTRPVRFTDAAGTPLPLLCRVQQIALDLQGGAVAAQLPRHGQLLGCHTTGLPVCVDRDWVLVLLRPHLVCALDPPGGAVMSTAMTVGWLELRDAALGAARRGWPITPGIFLGTDRRWRGRDGASALCPVQDTWCDAPVTALDRAWEIWDARPYSVLLVCGRGIDALAVPPRLSWLLTAPEVPRAPLATVTPSRGWLLFAATASGAVADGLATQGVRLRSRGTWAPLPPTATQFLFPGRWVNEPPQPGVGRLPTTDEVQHGLLSALRSGTSAKGSAG